MDAFIVRDEGDAAIAEHIKRTETTRAPIYQFLDPWVRNITAFPDASKRCSQAMNTISSPSPQHHLNRHRLPLLCKRDKDALLRHAVHRERGDASVCMGRILYRNTVCSTPEFPLGGKTVP